MSEIARQTNLDELSEIYAKLNEQEIEQFYIGYQWWNLQQRSVTLQEQIEDLHREIAANAELMEMTHPPAIALATMARLQASGVKDLDLLDRMLERGEDWLDRTMQRLDYCEQLDFIIDDYTQWCQNALEGAYDWIDSMREGGTASSTEVPTGDTSTEATEELLLQKLTSEEEEQPPSPETTLRSSASSALEEPALTSEEHATTIEESQGTVETPSDLEEAMPEAQLSQGVETGPASATPAEESITQENVEPEFQPSKPEDPSSTSAGAINLASTASPPTELSPTLDSEPSVGEASESEQLISQVYIEFDPTPEELPSVEGNDSSDFRQPPLQEHSKDIFADESPMYWEETLPYRMYAPDKQPGSEADERENTEQGTVQGMMPERRRNFLQRFVAKIWRK